MKIICTIVSIPFVVVGTGMYLAGMGIAAIGIKLGSDKEKKK